MSRLRLGADHRHVDRHLPPAIDGVAEIDDLALDNGPAGFLRGKVSAESMEQNHNSY